MIGSEAAGPPRGDSDGRFNGMKSLIFAILVLGGASVAMFWGEMERAEQPPEIVFSANPRMRVSHAPPQAPWRSADSNSSGFHPLRMTQPPRMWALRLKLSLGMRGTIESSTEQTTILQFDGHPKARSVQSISTYRQVGAVPALTRSPPFPALRLSFIVTRLLAADDAGAGGDSATAAGGGAELTFRINELIVTRQAAASPCVSGRRARLPTTVRV